MGLLYYEGKGGVVDKQKAYECFVKASEGGHLRGRFNLAVMLTHCKQITPNPQKALVLFKSLMDDSYPGAKEEYEALRKSLKLNGPSSTKPLPDINIAKARQAEKKAVDQMQTVNKEKTTDEILKYINFDLKKYEHVWLAEVLSRSLDAFLDGKGLDNSKNTRSLIGQYFPQIKGSVSDEQLIKVCQKAVKFLLENNLYKNSRSNYDSDTIKKAFYSKTTKSDRSDENGQVIKNLKFEKDELAHFSLANDIVDGMNKLIKMQGSGEDIKTYERETASGVRRRLDFWIKENFPEIKIPTSNRDFATLYQKAMDYLKNNPLNDKDYYDKRLYEVNVANVRRNNAKLEKTFGDNPQFGQHRKDRSEQPKVKDESVEGNDQNKSDNYIARRNRR